MRGKQMSQLRVERKRRGWTLSQVSVVARIAVPDLSLLERGLRPAWPGWRCRLSKAFAIAESELFGEGR